jgi:hypothetical protein
VVVKTPKTSRSENLIAKINVSLLNYSHERFGPDSTFEDFLKSDYEGSMKAFFRDRKSIG